MELTLLHREPSLVVFDKPTGLPVDADSAHSVVAILSRQLAPPGGRAWPRVVHRLDRDTTGCLVVALNQSAEQGILRAFDERAVKKRYLALVQGKPPNEGDFDTPYGPDPRDRRRFTTHLDTPRRARLTFQVRDRLRGAALVEVTLLTGRTHQIRVQFAEAGFPLLGDPVYGVPAPEGAPLARVALHAERLAFPHPVQPIIVECSAPIPADMAGAMVALR